MTYGIFNVGRKHFKNQALPNSAEEQLPLRMRRRINTNFTEQHKSKEKQTNLTKSKTRQEK